jgi:hypothetical protein
VTTYYLIGATTVLDQGASKRLQPGTMLDDAHVDTASLSKSGALLWPTTDAKVATAAARVNLLRRGQGIDESAAESIMRSAVSLSNSSGGGGGPVQVAFDYTSPTTMTLQAVNPGNVLFHAVVVVQEAFNGPGASLQLGTTALPGEVFGPSQALLSNPVTFDAAHVLLFFQNDFFIMTFNFAGSSRGSGLLVYELLD